MGTVTLKQKKYIKHGKEYAKYFKKEISFYLTEEGKEKISFTENPVSLAFYNDLLILIKLIETDRKKSLKYLDNLDEITRSTIKLVAQYLKPELKSVIFDFSLIIEENLKPLQYKKVAK